MGILTNLYKLQIRFSDIIYYTLNFAAKHSTRKPLVFTKITLNIQHNISAENNRKDKYPQPLITLYISGYMPCKILHKYVNPIM